MKVLGLSLFLLISCTCLNAQVTLNLLKDINAYQTQAGMYENPVGAQLAHANGQTFFFAKEPSTGLELWKAVGTTPSFVKDITPGPTSSFVSDMVASGNLAFFGVGTSLWVSNGTTNGTILLRTFSVGVTHMTDLNGVLLFYAKTPESGWELWRSDGTVAGTVMIKDIFVGTTGSEPADRIVIGNTFYFSAKGSDAQGREFWKTDGTEAGTVMVKDLYTNSESSAPRSFVNANGKVCFLATVQGELSIVTSDGTAAGTTSVRTPYSNYPKDATITAAGNKLYFVYWNSINQLWAITAGENDAAVIKTFDPALTTPANYRSFNNTLYFIAEDADHGLELWKSDGTTAGTTMIVDSNPGTADGLSHTDPYPRFTQVGSYLYYVSTINGYQLTRTDGTAAGTEVVTDLDPAYPSIQYLCPAGDQVYFLMDDFLHGPSIWKTDGSAAGATLIKDIEVTKTLDSNISQSIFYNGFHYFRANDSEHGHELWRTDGTPAGTALFMDFKNPPSLNYHSSVPDQFTIYNNKLYFTVEENDGHRALWRTDGTIAGTLKINDIPDANNIYVVNGKLVVISKSTQAEQFTIWFTDGTPGNAVSHPQVFTHHGTLKISADGTLGLVVFNTAATGQELWRTDGTVAGTYMLGDIFPGAQGSTAGAELTELNGIFYFSAGESFAVGSELWRTDGTTSGTYKVADLCAGSCDGSPLGMKVIDQYLYFTARDAAESWSMFRTDGTSAGTQFLFSPVPGYQPFGAPIGYQDVNGKVVYNNVISSNGGSILSMDIWSMDKTTLQHTKVNEGNLNTYFSSYKVRDHFVTIANHATTGAELWKSDGTIEGTSILKDINPGPESFLGLSLEMRVINDAVYFIADDGSGSPEQLWKSDGDCSTIKITQAPGNVKGYFVMGDKMIVVVDHPDYGIEPFYYSLADEPELVCLDDQTITFNAFTDRVFENNLEVPLQATADSGLPVSFTSNYPALATVENGKLIIHGAGQAIITATQTGNSQYNPATPVSREIRILKGNQEIQFIEMSEVSLNEVSFNADATSTSGLPVTLTPSNGIVSVDGLTVNLLDAGEVTLTATQPGNENFNPAEPVSRVLTIQLITGIDEHQTALKIYPNPATDFIRFEPAIQNTSITAINPLGSYTTLPLEGNTCDVRSLQPGMYFIQWKEHTETRTVKVIITR